MLNLSTDSIRDATDNGAYDRGSVYYSQGRVNSLRVDKIDEELTIITATVHGSAAVAYRQQVEILHFFDDSFDIDGNCSCPVSYNCKHVVAVCLAYQARSKPPTPGEKTRDSGHQSLAWLTQFSQADRTHVAPETTDLRRDFIAYILQPTGEPGGVEVQLLITRQLKNGGLGKGRRTNFEKINSHYDSPAYVRASDLDIAKLLYSQYILEWGSPTLKLSGEIGYLSLIKMLSTERCFWLNTSGTALQMGEPRALKMNWGRNDNTAYQLKLDIEPKAMPLNTYPAMYLDVEVLRLGRLTQTDFSERQWAMLLDAPAVPASAAVEFSHQLVKQMSSTALPHPIKMATIALDAEDYQPCVTLLREQKAAGQNRHILRLDFYYGGYRCDALPRTPIYSFIEANTIINIRRDLAQEKTAMDRLLAQNFRVLADVGSKTLLQFCPAAAEERITILYWQHLLDQVLPQLEAEGWRVEIDASFKLTFLQAEEWHAEIDSDTDNQWFDLRFDLTIQGKKIPLLPLITDILSNYTSLDELPEILSLPMGDSQYLQLPAERIRPICKTLYELFDHHRLGDSGELRLHRYDAARLDDLDTHFSKNG
ncbi:MAG: SWIM zinc finger domain-containing protein, partial [Thiohalomonadales bacterium]